MAVLASWVRSCGSVDSTRSTSKALTLKNRQMASAEPSENFLACRRVQPSTRFIDESIQASVSACRLATRAVPSLALPKALLSRAPMACFRPSDGRAAMCVRKPASAVLRSCPKQAAPNGMPMVCSKAVANWPGCR